MIRAVDKISLAWQHRRWVSRAVVRWFSDSLSEAIFHGTHPLKPTPVRSASFALEGLSAAIDRGLQFIRTSQRPDGSFRGFLLFPGASVSWITAHVALLLEEVPKAQTLCLKAAKFLRVAGLQNSGWGYNELVRNDVDSTAQALMVLHRHHLPLPPAAVAMLLEAQSSSGGFPTFPASQPDHSPASGWEMPHPDVTLMAIECLKRLGTHTVARNRAIDWLATRVDSKASYWWNDPAYAFWAANFADLATDEMRELARGMIPAYSAAPYLAMLLAILAERAPKTDVAWAAAARLVAGQAADGSWACSPCLRTTELDEYQSHKDARGTVCRDSRRLFSTAHSVAALSQMELSMANMPPMANENSPDRAAYTSA